MAEETIVAVYDTASHAQAALSDLRAANVPEDAISIQAGGTPATAAATQPREQGFWSSLFGGSPDHDTTVYDRSVQGGSSVITVRVPDHHVAAVLQILEAHHPIDIDERATSYGLTQTMATPAPAVGGDTLQLAEEQLVVGKRLVNRGGTRIRRFVVETPVEEQVTLRDEMVTLERRPVTDGRPATDSFSEKAVELTATGEEAVVGKTARVVEEVALRKETVDHVETIRDTVRKEEVAVEQIPAATTTTTGTTGTTAPRTPKI